MAISRNTPCISTIDFWILLIELDYIPKKFLALGAVGACHGMSVMAIVHFQDGKKGLDKLNRRLHFLYNYANENDNFNRFKHDLAYAKQLKTQKKSTEAADELIEIDIFLQNCAIAHCLSFYDQFLQKPVSDLLQKSIKDQNALTSFSLVNSISGEKQGLVKPSGGNFLNSYSKKDLADVISLLKKELSNFSFKHPVHVIASNKNHDICFSYFPENKQWAYFGIREKVAFITQDNELITHIWNNLNLDTRADIGMEVYLAKNDVRLFEQCHLNLKQRNDWMALQAISVSSVNLAAVGSKFSDIDNVRNAVSCHSFFSNNKTPVSFFIIVCVVMAATNINDFAKAGSIIFALLWASINCRTDNRLNKRIEQSSMLKEVESYVESKEHHTNSRLR